jgi:hypothetical protein
VLKRELLAAPLPSTRDVDVWFIADAPTADQPAERHLSPGDRVVLPRRLRVDPGGLPVADNGPDQVMLVTPPDGIHTVQLTGADRTVAEVRLVVEPRPHGDHRPDRPAAAAPDDTEATA